MTILEQTSGSLRIGLMRVLFFFFFQAEDGIGDGRVTGVQTCALPISSRGSTPAAPRSSGSSKTMRASSQPRLRSRDPRPRRRLIKLAAERPNFRPQYDRSDLNMGNHEEPGRSEERRVGKEGRSAVSTG